MSSTEEHFAVFEEDDDFEEFQVEGVKTEIHFSPSFNFS